MAETTESLGRNDFGWVLHHAKRVVSQPEEAIISTLLYLETLSYSVVTFSYEDLLLLIALYPLSKYTNLVCLLDNVILYVSYQLYNSSTVAIMLRMSTYRCSSLAIMLLNICKNLFNNHDLLLCSPTTKRPETEITI